MASLKNARWSWRRRLRRRKATEEYKRGRSSAAEQGEGFRWGSPMFQKNADPVVPLTGEVSGSDTLRSYYLPSAELLPWLSWVLNIARYRYMRSTVTTMEIKNSWYFNVKHDKEHNNWGCLRPFFMHSTEQKKSVLLLHSINIESQ